MTFSMKDLTLGGWNQIIIFRWQYMDEKRVKIGQYMYRYNYICIHKDENSFWLWQSILAEE
jgi:hypothetical protein